MTSDHGSAWVFPVRMSPFLDHQAKPTPRGLGPGEAFDPARRVINSRYDYSFKPDTRTTRCRAGAGGFFSASTVVVCPYHDSFRVDDPPCTGPIGYPPTALHFLREGAASGGLDLGRRRAHGDRMVVPLGYSIGLKGCSSNLTPVVLTGSPGILRRCAGVIHLPVPQFL
jgi:hypothetical protein